MTILSLYGPLAALQGHTDGDKLFAVIVTVLALIIVGLLALDHYLRR